MAQETGPSTPSRCAEPDSDDEPILPAPATPPVKRKRVTPLPTTPTPSAPTTSRKRIAPVAVTGGKALPPEPGTLPSGRKRYENPFIRRERNINRLRDRNEEDRRAMAIRHNRWFWLEDKLWAAARSIRRPLRALWPPVDSDDEPIAMPRRKEKQPQRAGASQTDAGVSAGDLQ